VSILTCQWPDCERTNVIARGLCQRCYKRASKAGTLEVFTAPVRECGYCGSEFATGKNGKHAYCSFDCQRAGVRARREEARKARGLVCFECGKPIEHTQRNDAKHCSVDCQKSVWYRENAERVKRQASTWKSANRDRAKDCDHKRRALMRGSRVGPVDYEAVWARDNGCCWICGEAVDASLKYPHPMYRSWDHITPISAGGAHSMDNIALSHLRCNISKKDKILDRRPAWAG
jgi:5-methylcytosine-specific restriction endonuclease McrA